MGRGDRGSDYALAEGNEEVSLDVYLKAVRLTTVYDANITHNLTKMAEKADIYYELWRPEEINISTARQLIEPLIKGLELLKSNPDKFKEYNSPNGWGMYEHFVPFVERYIEACKENPDAIIEVSR